MQYPLYLGTALLVALSLLLLGTAQAASWPYRYQTDAQLEQPNGQPANDARAFLEIHSFRPGEGRITLVFANGSRSSAARFNARVRFYDEDGELLREEHFESRLGAADADGAFERRLSRALRVEEFARVDTEFYLDGNRPLQSAGLD